MDEILQVLPQTRQVFVVLGSGPLGQFWHRVLEDEFERFPQSQHRRRRQSTLERDRAGSVRPPPQSPGQPKFDWRELQRWRIAESRLPADSLVLYRGPSLWREYRATVLSAAGAMVIQSLLIVGLLYQRRARQRAEIDSRRNLALAADASRRQTMSALTSSIAHELGQPLSSIMYNAQALQMMVSANRATSDTIGEILSDIQSQGVRARQIIDHRRTMLRSRQLDKKPIFTPLSMRALPSSRTT
jgi:signal transduction histidine kinase